MTTPFKSLIRLANLYLLDIKTITEFLAKQMERSFSTWWLSLAQNERLAQQHDAYDMREMGYRTDPMNVLAERALGPKECRRRLALRIGLKQMQETRGLICS